MIWKSRKHLPIDLATDLAGAEAALEFAKQDMDVVMHELTRQFQLVDAYQTRAEAAEATLERVRAAGRVIVLKSVHGRTIIHDAGIMQDDAQTLAEAILDRTQIEDLETQEDIYREAGFLTSEDIA